MAKQEREQLTTKTVRNLMCELTNDEKREYGRKLADLEHDKDIVEADKKASADSFKEKLSAIDAGISRLVGPIRDGVERRDVECEWVYHWETFAKDLVRCDTGEVVITEAITPRERQLGFDGIDNNA